MIERVDVAKRVMHINTPAGAKEVCYSFSVCNFFIKMLILW